jgi:hypothetical protein
MTDNINGCHVDKRYYNELYGNMIGDMDWTDLIQDRDNC